MINDLKIETRPSIRQQITDHLRDGILTEKLSPGSHLPSTQEMTKIWGTRESNVHRALTVLVKEGLITRKPGVGTIICKRKCQLETIAVYVNSDLSHPASSFLRLLLGFLESEMHERGLECQVIFENRQGSGFAQLKEMAEKRLIQGIVVPRVDRVLRPQFEKLPVPFSCMTSAKVDNKVDCFNLTLIDYAIEGLVKQGCQTMGFLSSLPDSREPRESGEREQHRFFNTLHAKANAAGLELRDEWIVCPPRADCIDLGHYNHFAFEGLDKIWSEREKPDGLFVFTDDLITGTLFAIMQQRIRIPEELKLVLFRHVENDLLCPVPCLFVEDSIRDIAQGLISLIEDQYHGKPIQSIPTSFRLTQHN
jgi:DNA-binding LacI/PurR family transcriptional regulator